MATRFLPRRDLSSLRPGDVFVRPRHINALDHKTIVPEERIVIEELGDVEDFPGGRFKRSIIGRGECGETVRMDIYAGTDGHKKHNIIKASVLVAAE